MLSTYDRNFIRDYFVFKAEQINPAFCIGRRKNPDSELVNFALRFFMGLSAEELDNINALVDPKEDEVLIEFFKEVEGKNPEVLTEDERKAFDFSREWYSHRMSTSWDELREVPQNMLAIVFESE